ncbi:two-component system, NtrC family, C4-dicarboxylate transport sensor histidine kinase DctB [Cohaesibacter sp. ES.047]|uniref:sensor histidine kinase n=1 Tax=Cohaesibacter sp. ES.047 TaxID=1798205 RepID=UPI000BB6D989|nr:ATP-binding protein [Cohaesibacter sp. ES.047]SNY91289.1 two-component system, NtrC family, C4-dicarboxylate transport sensor histidine kinase DctB [Cohaesibacter sp. ES.047]
MFEKVLSVLKVELVHAAIIFSILTFVSIPFYGEMKNSLTSSELLLNMYRSSLETEISRYKYLPFILSQNDKLVEILFGEMGKEESGYFLQRTKYATNVSTVYVLDSNGNTVASSNWHTDESYIGENFGFQPYFDEAMAGRLGQYYGAGTTSSKPGFFIAYGLKSNGEIVGVVSIEIHLSELEQVWRSGPDDVLVYDVNDVVFLSSNRDWKYKVLGKENGAPIPPTLDAFSAPFQTGAPDDQSLVKCYQIGEASFYKDPRLGCLLPATLSIQEEIIEYGWTILSLKSTRPIYTALCLVVFISLLIYLILIFSYRSFKNRFNKSIQKLRNQVVENSKLAAIGQMATEVAHEFNQPLAAIHMLLDTTRLLLKRQRFDEADDNLELISSHIERMAQQMSQMKSFASRHRVPRGNGEVVSVANATIKLFRLTLEKQNVQLNFQSSQSELHVSCNEIGLEQIFSNLISNALDAMEGQVRKCLTLAISKRDGEVTVRVHDNGCGFKDPSRIFESFYSTKQRGTGLGLAIVNDIIENSGGSISAQNHPDGGAEFVLKWRELVA